MVGRCVGEDGDACLEGWSVFGAEEVRVGIEEGDEVGWGVCCDVDVECCYECVCCASCAVEYVGEEAGFVSLMEMRML